MVPPTSSPRSATNRLSFGGDHVVDRRPLPEDSAIIAGDMTEGASPNGHNKGRGGHCGCCQSNIGLGNIGPVSRAPHLWLTRSGERVSTLDLAGHHVLLAGPDGAEWIEAAVGATESLGGLNLDAYRVGSELGDAGDRFAEAYGISSNGASLVRPDGFIAWRSHGDTADRVGVLREALARSLGN
jgi:hypothetical protein